MNSNGAGSNVARFPGSQEQQFRPPETQPLTPFFPSSLEGTEPEALQWIVPDLIPRGFATLFTGNFSLGKSYLLLDLLTTAALGRHWLGYEIEPCTVFGLFCEDPKDRLQWRLAQILRHHDASYADLERYFAWDARFGKYNALMQFHRYSEQGKTTPLWSQLWHLTTKVLRAKIILVDTSRQTFDGNENSSRQVTEFVNHLNKLAEAIGGAVILTHHPPKAGTSEYSGSGAWAGTMRNHLHLARPEHFDPVSREGWDERVLRPMDNRYDGERRALNLRWDTSAMMFVLDDVAPVTNGHASDMFGRMSLDLQVLQAVRSLILDGSLPHAARERQSNLAALVRRLPGFRGTPETQIWAASDRLLDKGELIRVEYGAVGNRRVLLRPPDLRFPGEA